MRESPIDDDPDLKTDGNPLGLPSIRRGIAQYSISHDDQSHGKREQLPELMVEARLGRQFLCKIVPDQVDESTAEELFEQEKCGQTYPFPCTQNNTSASESVKIVLSMKTRNDEEYRA